MTDQTETAEHNPAGAIRMFRSGDGSRTFPDGLVHIIGGNTEPDLDDYRVTYVTPPDGLSGRAFHALGHELTRPTHSFIDASAWWVITVPGLPTFYLNGAVQGIVDAERADRIARQIVDDPRITVARLTDIIS
jgi:hypothetical protein